MAASKSAAVQEWTKYILVIPDLMHLVIRLLLNPEISSDEKFKLGAGLFYIFLPMDLFPEGLLGPLGYLDDFALSVMILNSIFTTTRPDIIRALWAGDEKLLIRIMVFVKKMDEKIGSGLWERLKRWLKNL